VAAVREAVLHGWPGIAVSHYRKTGVAFDWDRATEWIRPILQDLLTRPCQAGFFYNVNLPLLPPHVTTPEVVWCELDPKPLPLNYRHEEASGLYFAGDYNLRGRTRGSDVDVCFSGRIAVTAVRLL
jgi:5'-nucleotidase